MLITSSTPPKTAHMVLWHREKVHSFQFKKRIKVPTGNSCRQMSESEDLHHFELTTTSVQFTVSSILCPHLRRSLCLAGIRHGFSSHLDGGDPFPARQFASCPTHYRVRLHNPSTDALLVSVTGSVCCWFHC